MQQLLNKLKQELGQKLPGQEAQYKMAPFGRERLESATSDVNLFRKSAVMILICADMEDNLYIPLIERMVYNGVHSGQIALPGGKFEESDETLQNTAIRECHEEIGIKELEVVGTLTQLHIPVSRFLVQPFVATCSLKNPRMNYQEREVNRVLKLGLNSLLDDNISKTGEVLVQNNLKIKAPYFEVENKKVWGATGMILSELKELLKRATY